MTDDLDPIDDQADLAARLQDAAGSPAALDVDALHGRVRTRARRRRAAGAAAAAAVLIVLAGVVTVATGQDDPPRSQVVAGEGPSSSTTEPDASTTTGSVVFTSTTDVATATTVVETTTPVDTSTSIVATTTPSPPSPTTTTPGGTTTAFAVEGTYSGQEQYRLNGPCPQLTQRIVSVFEVVGGEGTWQYEADYCGRIEGDRWYGKGTGTFTIPSGACCGPRGLPSSGGTIEVEIDDSTAQPTDGEPYTLQVTGGTGAYRGAGGSCDLTVHIEPKGFGRQDQSGDWRCDIFLGGPSSQG